MALGRGKGREPPRRSVWMGWASAVVATTLKSRGFDMYDLFLFIHRSCMSRDSTASCPPHNDSVTETAVSWGPPPHQQAHGAPTALLGFGQKCHPTACALARNSSRGQSNCKERWEMQGSTWIFSQQYICRPDGGGGECLQDWGSNIFKGPGTRGRRVSGKP